MRSSTFGVTLTSMCWQFQWPHSPACPIALTGHGAPQLGLSPSLAGPCTLCQRWEILFSSGAGIVSAEQRLSLQSLGYFWSLLLVLFNTLSNYSVSGNTELLKKHSKQFMVMACSAVLLKGAESNLYPTHYSSNIAETGRKGFNFFP